MRFDLFLELDTMGWACQAGCTLRNWGSWQVSIGSWQVPGGSSQVHRGSWQVSRGSWQVPGGSREVPGRFLEVLGRFKLENAREVHFRGRAWPWN